MGKKTIATLLILNVVLIVAGTVLILSSLSNLFTTVSHLAVNGPVSTSVSGTTVTVTNGSSSVQVTLNPGLLAGGILLALLGSVMHLVSWIGALVATARLSSWGWFVCIFLFHWVALLIYLIAGPSVAMLYAPQPQVAPQYMPPPQG